MANVDSRRAQPMGRKEADMGFLIAVRPIDVAILGTLGALWLGGALFIYVLYRWIIRYERAESSGTPPGVAENEIVDDARAGARRRELDARGREPTPSASSDSAVPAHA
jgi:hypothetical protein